jgi:hypothetical protein
MNRLILHSHPNIFTKLAQNFQLLLNKQLQDFISTYKQNCTDRLEIYTYGSKNTIQETGMPSWTPKLKL